MVATVVMVAVVMFIVAMMTIAIAVGQRGGVVAVMMAHIASASVAVGLQATAQKSPCDGMCDGMFGCQSFCLILIW